MDPRLGPHHRRRLRVPTRRHPVRTRTLTTPHQPDTTTRRPTTPRGV